MLKAELTSTRSWSGGTLSSDFVFAALSQVRANSPVAIGADQLIFTPYDAFDVCREKAADLIVLGLHETGGISRYRKTANIAEAAGIKVCIHGQCITSICSNSGITINLKISIKRS